MSLSETGRTPEPANQGEAAPWVDGLTIGEALEQTATRYPTAEAVVFPHLGLRWTWSQFLTEVDRAARGLYAIGIRPGQHVAIWATNVPEWIVVQFATARIGAVLVTINPAYRPFELQYVLKQSDAVALILVDRFKSSDYFAMLNEKLAKHYGIPGVSGPEIRRVPLPPGSPRGGFLTQAAILKITANGTTTSPVPRGAFVMARLLGQEPEPPPPNVPAVEPDVRGATTIREQLAKHQSVKTCASCHQKIDPPGFALESFDVMGGFRERYRALDGKTPEVGIGKNGQKFAFHNALPVEAYGELDGKKFKAPFIQITTNAEIEEALKQLAHTAILRLDSLDQMYMTATGGGQFPNRPLHPRGDQAAAPQPRDSRNRARRRSCERARRGGSPRPHTRRLQDGPGSRHETPLGRCARGGGAGGLGPIAFDGCAGARPAWRRSGLRRRVRLQVSEWRTGRPIVHLGGACGRGRCTPTALWLVRPSRSVRLRRRL